MCQTLPAPDILLECYMCKINTQKINTQIFPLQKFPPHTVPVKNYPPDNSAERQLSATARGLLVVLNYFFNECIECVQHCQ